MTLHVAACSPFLGQRIKNQGLSGVFRNERRGYGVMLVSKNSQAKNRGICGFWWLKNEPHTPFTGMNPKRTISVVSRDSLPFLVLFCGHICGYLFGKCLETLMKYGCSDYSVSAKHTPLNAIIQRGFLFLRAKSRGYACCVCNQSPANASNPNRFAFY